MIDPTKTYRTRDGREVRIYAVDGEAGYPVHGAVKTDRGWSAASWCPSGKTNDHVPHPLSGDLIEIKPKHVRWMNVYPSGGVVHDTKEHADSASQTHRLACIRIEFEEGEGL